VPPQQTQYYHQQRRFGPDISRILFVRSIPVKITTHDMYKIFGRYGPIRQIRVGNTDKTKGTAFIVYHDTADAKHAFEALTGFNVEGRFLHLSYFHGKRRDGGVIALEEKKAENAELKNKYLST
jgi:pre-mRNA branch site protein p14